MSTKDRLTEAEIFDLPCVGQIINIAATRHAIAVGKRTFEQRKEHQGPVHAEEIANDEEAHAYFEELDDLTRSTLAKARELGVLIEEESESEDESDSLAEDDSVIDCTDCSPSAIRCGACVTYARAHDAANGIMDFKCGLPS